MARSTVSSGEQYSLVNVNEAPTIDQAPTWRSTEETYVVNMPKCSIVVEPYIAIMFFTATGIFPTIEQFVYSEIASEYPALQNSTNHTVADACRTINDSDVLRDNVYNATQLVQAQTSRWMIYINVVQCIPRFFSTILIGGYSDKLYRKPALLLPAVGQFIELSVYFGVIYFKLNIVYVVGACLVNGFFGGPGTMNMASIAYVAEITSPDDRALRLVILDVILAIAGASAYFTFGMLIKMTGFAISTAVMLVMTALGIAYVIVLVPETHRPSPDATFSIRQSAAATWVTYTKEEGRRRPKLLMVVVIYLLVQFAMIGSGAVSVRYQMNYPLCWAADLIGINMAFGIVVIEAGSLLGAIVLRKWMSEASISIIGEISGALAFSFYSLSTTTLMVFIGQ